MKIAFISLAAFPSRSAESIHVAKMCEAFAEHGHQVTLVAPRRTPEPVGPELLASHYGVRTPFRVVKLPRPAIRGAARLFGAQAAAWCRRAGVDLVYSRDLNGAFFAATIGMRVMFEVHNAVDRVRGVSRWMLSRLLHHPRLVRLVVISDSLQRYFQQHHDLPAERILVAREAADAVDSADAAPVQLGPGALHVGYVGHLYPGKGMEVVVELAAACPWAVFHVVGGEEKDIRWWKEQRPGLDNLLFHGFVPHAVTAGYRQACDVLLAPYQSRVSDSRGGDIGQWMSPMKVFEYMASGKAILASNIAVVEEVVVDGETALLRGPEDFAGWTAALERLRDDPDLRARLGERAQAVFLREYTWPKRAAKVLRAAGATVAE
ncbi:glycosyltransferase family 4 protein [Longimicrobium sp.]|uniref:glycosyltransferase family 4 protein n=1 Tax=Longimicrobium sp. TaxID=2029185 RepID=UPI003B3A447D